MVKTFVNGSIDWYTTSGGWWANNQFNSVAVSTEGGSEYYIIAGQTAALGAGNWDGWALKYRDDGTTSWSYTFGGSSSDDFNSVAVCSGGGYVLAGSTDSTANGSREGWVVKLDSWGNVVWNKTFGGSSSDWFNSVAVCPDGGFILAGQKGMNAWLVKLNSSGSMEWEKTWGSPWRSDWFNSVAVCPGGGYILAGFNTSGWDDGIYGPWVMSVDASANTVWDITYKTLNDDFHSIAVTPDGGFIVAGEKSGAFAVRLNASGGEEWNKTFGGREFRSVSALNCPGGYIFAGTTVAPSGWGVLLSPRVNHTVNGTVTYHGAAQAGVVVNVSTNVGTFSNVTGPGGTYSIDVYYAQCVDTNITVQASYAGCSNSTGPFTPTGNSTTKNIDIAPPKATTVSGTVTYHGAGQSGATVNVTTNAGAWTTTSGSGGAYSQPVQYYECSAGGVTVQAGYAGCNNTTGPVAPTGGSTVIDVNIAPPEAFGMFINITYCYGAYAGSVVNVTTNAGAWGNVTDANGTATIDAVFYRCPASNVTLNWTTCGNGHSFDIPSTQVTDPLDVQIQVSSYREYVVRGNVTYHGAGQAGALVNVTTGVGTYGNVTGPGSEYLVRARVCDCQNEAIYDELIVNTSYAGCNNSTRPLQSTGDNATVNLDIAPPRAHTVNGTVTYRGTGQAGATVNINTSAGTYGTVSGPGGAYSVAVQIYGCPAGSITAQATYDGQTNTTGPVAPTGNATMLNIDIPGDPCNCAYYGYPEPCTYWLLPGCTKPAPPGVVATTTTAANTTATAATTTATTRTTTTAVTTQTTATTTTHTTVPTATTTTTPPPQDNTVLYAGLGILVLILVLIGLYLYLRR